MSARPLDRTTGHSDGKSTRLCSGTQWRLSATARLAWYGGESHRRYPAATERLQTSETMPKQWSEFSVLRAVPRKGGTGVDSHSHLVRLARDANRSGRPTRSTSTLLPAQPALTHRCWPQRDHHPLASAVAHATQQSPQSGSTRTGGGGSLGDLAREVSSTQSKIDEESDGDRQEA